MYCSWSLNFVHQDPSWPFPALRLSLPYLAAKVADLKLEAENAMSGIFLSSSDSPMDAAHTITGGLNPLKIKKISD